MPLELADLVAERPLRSRRRKRGRGKGVVAGGALAGVALAAVVWLAVRSRDHVKADAGGGPAPTTARADLAPPAKRTKAGDAAPTGPAVADVPECSLSADERALLARYPRESRLDGLDMLASGELDAAREWLGDYLAAPSDGREDQAMLALAVAHVAAGESELAESALLDLVSRRPDSNRSGDGYYLLGKIRSTEGRAIEARQAYLEAVRVYGESHGGRRSAKHLADELYEKHVKGYPRRTEWERIRDLYSISVRGLVREVGGGRAPAEAGRPEGLPADWDGAEIIGRLDELNDWVIFTRHARPKEGYPTNVGFHRVESGNTLGGIARRYAVTVGSLKRLNGIAPESHVIRRGDELKYVRGRTEIHVDTRELVMTVWIDKRFFRRYPVGIGAGGRTPVGRFRVASRVTDPDWWHQGRLIPFGDERNILGTRWLGFEKTGAGRGIGIHGSREVDGSWEGVGERTSNGCIRMRNPDAEELFDFVPAGTEVVVFE